MFWDHRVYRADSLLMAAAIIWGSAFVAQRVGMTYVGPLTFNGVRFALGTMVLLPIAWRGEPKPHMEQGLVNSLTAWPAVWGGAVTGLVLFIAATLQQVGLVYTTAGKAGFITGLYVIIVPLLGLFWGHRPGWGGWLGACLATGGLYLLSVTGVMTFAPGDLWELAGAFFWAVHVLLLSWLSPRMNRVKLACAQYAVCSLLSLIGAGFTEQIALDGLRGALTAILYGGVLSVGVAYTLQVIAQRDAPPIHAAIILSLEAVFAALAGWLVLDEVLSPRGLIGCILMFSGMLTALLRS
ncbi:MAG: DMT family transporter [Deltaproteobacteria bacterium]|nr:MAG: DMT family transporter [Deltaproteobacteria bacterium]